MVSRLAAAALLGALLLCAHAHPTAAATAAAAVDVEYSEPIEEMVIGAGRKLLAVKTKCKDGWKLVKVEERYMCKVIRTDSDADGDIDDADASTVVPTGKKTTTYTYRKGKKVKRVTVEEERRRRR